MAFITRTGTSDLKENKDFASFLHFTNGGMTCFQ